MYAHKVSKTAMLAVKKAYKDKSRGKRATKVLINDLKGSRVPEQEKMRGN